jgi:hypothetical protein
MAQTFEYLKVDPATWMNSEPLNFITGCSITRDCSADTLYYATIDSTEVLPESYVRVYLVCTQDKITEKFPLGTFLVQTPSTSFNGRISHISMDAYSPLLELKDSKPPFGYAVPKGTKIMELAAKLCRENCRAPVVETSNTEVTKSDFIATEDDTWLSFLSDFIANADYIFDVDEMGRILFEKKQDTASLQPVTTYFDDDMSILYPDTDLKQDFYGIPNVVEIVYSSLNGHLFAKAVNNDTSSPISVANRGRIVLHRIMNPDFPGAASQEYLNRYAEQTLREMSTLEYTLQYSHGFTTARVGDCVRIYYSKAGLEDVKVRISSQTIECVPGCKVSETGVYTQRLYGEG